MAIGHLTDSGDLMRKNQTELILFYWIYGCKCLWFCKQSELMVKYFNVNVMLDKSNVKINHKCLFTKSVLR